MSLFFSLFSFFDNFSNSPTLIVKLYESCLYGIGTAQKNRKEMLVDRKVKRGDLKYLYSTGRYAPGVTLGCFLDVLRTFLKD